MEREVDLNKISDGKTYQNSDMVKVGCNDCEGCSACCQGMGKSIVLDPYDVYYLTLGLGKTFAELMEQNIELNVVDGMILPNLKLSGAEEKCTFLTAQGRCSIHDFRPGMCRLFPLGRLYENKDFRYFNQLYECPKENKSKVKIKKWLGIADINKYENFIKEWHYFLLVLQEKIKENLENEKVKQWNLLILQSFFLLPYEKNTDFYEAFRSRMGQVKSNI